MMPRLPPMAAICLIGLAAINGWLLLVLADEIGPGASETIDTKEWAPNLTLVGQAIAVRPALDSYKETLTRPIFFKSRQPYIPPPPAPFAKPAVSSTTKPEAGLIIGGVIIDRGVKKAFLLSMTANSQGMWVSEGDVFLGWTVRSIDQQGAELQQQDRIVQISLYPRN